MPDFIPNFLGQMYRETRFRIIAFIPARVSDDEPLFLATPLKL